MKSHFRKDTIAYGVVTAIDEKEGARYPYSVSFDDPAHSLYAYPALESELQLIHEANDIMKELCSK